MEKTSQQYLEEMEARFRDQLEREGTPRWVEEGLRCVRAGPILRVDSRPPPSLLFFLEERYGQGRV